MKNINKPIKYRLYLDNGRSIVLELTEEEIIEMKRNMCNGEGLLVKDLDDILLAVSHVVYAKKLR